MTTDPTADLASAIVIVVVLVWAAGVGYWMGYRDGRRKR